MKQVIISFFFLAVLSFSVKGQYGLKKTNITAAFNVIKTTFNYPETCVLNDYEVYQGSRNRKCIDIAIIEIKAQNAFGVSSLNNFMCYFFNGKFFYHHDSPYKPSFVGNLDKESASELMEMAVNSAINIEKSISQSELCKTDAEIEAAAKWEKQQANIKAEEERLKLERQEADKKNIAEIQTALSQEQYYKAFVLRQKLNDKTVAIASEVDEKWYALKSKIDSLYSDYLASYETQKKTLYEEYFEDTAAFMDKYRDAIEILPFQWKGKEEVVKYINENEYFSRTAWHRYGNIPLENQSVYYKLAKSKHIIIPTNPYVNSNLTFYNKEYIDQIKIAVTLSEKNYLPIALMKTFKNKISIGDDYITNACELQVPYLSIDFPEELKEYLDDIDAQDGYYFLENYSKKTMMLESFLTLSASLDEVEMPANEYKNDKYEELKNFTASQVKDFYTFRDNKPINKIDLHPAFKQFILSMNGGNDSLLIFWEERDKPFPSDLGIVKHYDSDPSLQDRWEYHFYFLPLKKGKIEVLKNENKIRVYSGSSYQDVIYSAQHSIIIDLANVLPEPSEEVNQIFNYEEWSFYTDRYGTPVSPDYFFTNDSIVVVYFPTSQMDFIAKPESITLNNKSIDYFTDCITNLNKYLNTKKERYLKKANKYLQK